MHVVTAPFSVSSTLVDVVIGILRAADRDLCLQEPHIPVKLHGHITYDHSQLMIITPVNLHGHICDLSTQSADVKLVMQSQSRLTPLRTFSLTCQVCKGPQRPLRTGRRQC